MHKGFGFGRSAEVQPLEVELSGARTDAETHVPKEQVPSPEVSLETKEIVERAREKRLALMEQIVRKRMAEVFGSEAVKKVLGEGLQWVPVISGAVYGLEAVRGKTLVGETVPVMHRSIDAAIAGCAAMVAGFQSHGRTREALLSMIPSMALGVSQTAIRRLSPERQRQLEAKFDAGIEAIRSALPDTASFVESVRAAARELPYGDELILLNLESFEGQAS